MKRKLMIIVAVCLLLGLTGAYLLKVYITPLTRIYYSQFLDQQYIDPKAQIRSDHEYQIRIWYYPFLRTVVEKDELELFQLFEQELRQKFPGIRFELRELNFLNGREQLFASLKEGNPPDVYFNFGCDSYLNKQFQLPVQDYMGAIEDDNNRLASTLMIEGDIWGWPFGYQYQYWPGAEKKLVSQLEQKLPSLEEGELLLNYYDSTLLRQLLTLAGLSSFSLQDSAIPEAVLGKLERTFALLSDLRSRNVINTDITAMIRGYLEDDLIIGPVNPWLHNYLLGRDPEMERNALPGLVAIFTLNVFHQEDYKGDDHTRAAMEVAKYISSTLINVLAAELELNSAIVVQEHKKEIRPLMRVEPDALTCWQEKVLPAWYAFWEEELTVAEVMTRILDEGK